MIDIDSESFLAVVVLRSSTAASLVGAGIRVDGILFDRRCVRAEPRL